MKDEHQKLSKRNGDASFQDLLEKGYLPQAVLNYIALLGWAPEEEREIYSLDELAQRFYVSKYHLSHEFSKTMGISVYRYICLKRLLSARQMLLNGMPAGEVYTKCGFKDYTNFYRAFKAEYGISPSEVSK